MTIRANRSVSMRKMPPTSAEAGIRILWSGPTKSRVTWGMIRPTNPMTPETATQAPTVRAVSTRMNRLVDSTSMPRSAALSSPISMALRSRERYMNTGTQSAINGKVIITLSHPADQSPPIIQKTMRSSFSSEM